MRVDRVFDRIPVKFLRKALKIDLFRNDNTRHLIWIYCQHDLIYFCTQPLYISSIISHRFISWPLSYSILESGSVGQNKCIDVCVSSRIPSGAGFVCVRVWFTRRTDNGYCLAVRARRARHMRFCLFRSITHQPPAQPVTVFVNYSRTRLTGGNNSQSN